MHATKSLAGLGWFVVALAGCAHSPSHLAELAAPHVGCNDDDVGIFEVRAREEERTDYIAYCHGHSFDCQATGDHAQCVRHGRSLVQDEERSRVSAPDREVHRSGEGNAVLLTVSIDAGRSRLTIYGYPRATGAPLTIVVDSRLREASRAECPFALVAGSDAVGLERTSNETTSYGERTTLTGPLLALRTVTSGAQASLRVCTEDLPITDVDRAAVATYLERWDAAVAEGR